MNMIPTISSVILPLHTTIVLPCWYTTIILPLYQHYTTIILPLYFLIGILPLYYHYTTIVLPLYYHYTTILYYLIGILPLYYHYTTIILPYWYASIILPLLNFGFTCQVASGALYQLRCVQSGSSCARVNVAVALQGEKASGSPTLNPGVGLVIGRV